MKDKNVADFILHWRHLRSITESLVAGVWASCPDCRHTRYMNGYYSIEGDRDRQAQQKACACICHWDWPRTGEAPENRDLEAVYKLPLRPDVSTRRLLRRNRSATAKAQLRTARTVEGSLMKPLLKWVGGKRQLLPELLKHVPKTFGRYWEPFVGGGALFWELRAQSRIAAPGGAYLSDNNLRLIRTYWAIRGTVDRVIALLKTYPYDSEFYYRMRATPNLDRLQDHELAAWFIYMNRAGFNGLYRVNKRGEFNVPFGRYTNPTICDEETLRACSKALQGVLIQAHSFDEPRALQPKHGDFVYFDPPYAPLSATSDFTAYTADGFGPLEQLRLRDYALTLKRAGVKVLLSNSSAPLIYDLYRRNFTIHEVSARRAINSNASKRGAVKELIIT